MSSLDLTKIDLVRTPACHGLTVEIEGMGQMKIEGHASSVLEQIASVYVVLSARSIISNGRWEEKVTVLALDVSRPYIKVRVAN